MKRENFILISIHTKGRGVSVAYQDKASTEGKTLTVKDPKIPHPDLLTAMKGARIFIAMTHHMCAIANLLEQEGTKMKSAANSANEMQQEILENIRVDKIAMSGREESRAVVISGYVHYKDTGSAINSPRIQLKGDMLGNEAALEETIEEITEEAFQYIFKNKAAQLSAFNEGD
jgi:hypothetical protein